MKLIRDSRSLCISVLLHTLFDTNFKTKLAGFLGLEFIPRQSHAARNHWIGLNCQQLKNRLLTVKMGASSYWQLNSKPNLLRKYLDFHALVTACPLVQIYLRKNHILLILKLAKSDSVPSWAVSIALQKDEKGITKNVIGSLWVHSCYDYSINTVNTETLEQFWAWNLFTLQAFRDIALKSLQIKPLGFPFHYFPLNVPSSFRHSDCAQHLQRKRCWCPPPQSDNKMADLPWFPLPSESRSPPLEYLQNQTKCIRFWKKLDKVLMFINPMQKPVAAAASVPSSSTAMNAFWMTSDMNSRGAVVAFAGIVLKSARVSENMSVAPIWNSIYG